MFTPDPKEIDTVLRLNLQQKYRYFVSKVADWGEVWVIFCQEELVTMRDNNRRLLLPVWPAQAYAQRNLNAQWAKCTATKLTLTHFMTEILPDMDGANMTVAMMVDSQCQTYVIAEAKSLLQDLIEACKHRSSSI